ncbi:hypothetical protein BKA82DRAFT_1004481 [Pisolithus tinctorius]|uniref:DUF6534 domain-containing protein n=1 Tax=Pisolithus tinctorius Marx 270 TaxID=870435 RepID=A0A0C3IS92_PISTI|nr:hypothetical protein BKA82DRAFT_1004481 [Pisolithus tinctorius]KIN99772.1 hypothetical protein M404DRAFT_1004481 [Pisolithus tinctorius Marx 270]
MSILGGFSCALIGGFVSVMLYGITTLQTYVYYMHYSEDASATKFLVAVIWVLDSLYASFMCRMLYYYLVTNYGIPTSLEYLVWSLPASLLVDVLVVFVVQCFFAHKIYHLCRPQVKWLVTAPILISVLAHFGFGMGMAVFMFVNTEASAAEQIRFSVLIPYGALAIVPEGLITASLCILLYDSSSRSMFPRTKQLLNTLIIYAVNRCLLTLLVAIGELTASVYQQNTWATVLDFIIGKLYANSLLASLNTRQFLRNQGSPSGTEPDRYTKAVHVANLPKRSDDVESSMDGARQFDMR